ncbi:hypothetical protein [Streptomyces sp. NPDC001759]
MSPHLSTTPESAGEGRPDLLPQEATAPAAEEGALHGAAPTVRLLRRLLRRRRLLWRLRGDRFTVTGHK